MINRLRARVEELEREKSEVETKLTDSKAETKVALESMEKERCEKDEVVFMLHETLNLNQRDRMGLRL